MRFFAIPDTRSPIDSCLVDTTDSTDLSIVAFHSTKTASSRLSSLFRRTGQGDFFLQLLILQMVNGTRRSKFVRARRSKNVRGSTMRKSFRGYQQPTIRLVVIRKRRNEDDEFVGGKTKRIRLNDQVPMTLESTRNGCGLFGSTRLMMASTTAKLAFSKEIESRRPCESSTNREMVNDTNHESIKSHT
jgi:hypothetical protein